MKKTVFFILMVCLALGGFAKGKQLSALFGYSSFMLPSKNMPYVETYLNFNAWSLNFAKADQEQYRATVEVTLVVSQADSVVYFKKYDLNGPAVADPEQNNFTFMDVQRFAIANGLYDMEITLQDKNSKEAPAVLKEKLVVYYPTNKPSMSNIQLMASATPTTSENMLSRMGYDMVPFIDDFVPAEIGELHPYFEIYNLNSEIEGKFMIATYIRQKETGRRITEERLTTYESAKTISPIYTDVDVKNVPSGNYELVAEVRNMNNEVLMSRDIAFQRSNPGIGSDDLTEAHIATSFAALITDEKEMDYYLNAIYAVSSPREYEMAEELLKDGTMAAKQTYFYDFWASRDKMNPEHAWAEYKAKLTYVDATYSYPKTPGYRTDRGLVYLKYGPPDYIRDEKNFVGALYINGASSNRYNSELATGNTNNPTVVHGSLGHVHYLPYQLWRYNQLPGNDKNRVFLFWDQYRSGYYKLLNSNAIGELQTAFWERMLSQNQLDEYVMGEVGEQFERGF